MFKNLINFWKGKGFLTQVLEEFKSMLDNSEEMFNSVCGKLIDNEGAPDLNDRIYSIDRKVNDIQRDIRKKIIEHLTLQPSVDVSASLLLMSVVKDAERLGDFSKNLLEVCKFFEKPINKQNYSHLFGNIDKEISDLFKETKKAFIDSDENTALKTWEYKREITKKSEDILQKLAKGNLSVNEAVCFTLIARYYKRVAAHLTNIATSVIVPLSDLDYFDERMQE